MSREVEWGVAPQFPARWSPRAFEPVAIPEADLRRFFEAARWTPSAFNVQPWRFLYAHRDTPQWPVFLDILIEFNRGWAEKASALVFVVAQRSFTPPGKTEVTVNNSYAFDTGAATFSLALQASLSGWAAHIITGFDKVKGKKVLHIPENHDLLAAVVLGKQGQPESLPESLRTRETPTPRKPQSEWVAEGVFTFAG